MEQARATANANAELARLIYASLDLIPAITPFLSLALFVACRYLIVHQRSTGEDDDNIRLLKSSLETLGRTSTLAGILYLNVVNVRHVPYRDFKSITTTYWCKFDPGTTLACCISEILLIYGQIYRRLTIEIILLIENTHIIWNHDIAPRSCAGPRNRWLFRAAIVNCFLWYRPNVSHPLLLSEKSYSRCWMQHDVSDIRCGKWKMSIWTVTQRMLTWRFVIWM